jgi:hypothetical protein
LILVPFAGHAEQGRGILEALAPSLFSILMIELFKSQIAAARQGVKLIQV